jgi:hypothetical protein
MNISIVNGTFSSKDSLDLIAQFIHAKIKFHESKIEQNISEEDLKMRELRIKELQRLLYEVRNVLLHKQDNIGIQCSIEISKS